MICDRLENIQHFSIAFDETKLGVDESLLLGILFYEYASFTQVVPRKTGKEMVSDLKVKAAVDEGEVWWAYNVGGRPELAVRERLCWTKVFRRHGKM